ncbi:MAG: molybdopterin dinucleotide binding domain-containing protein, partial [Eggerthellales bacterium]|nr:molybdopterin dinucleotide binding domain-containing protein [Eggerthellales bacterium]
LLETGVAMIPGTENWFPDGYADQVYGTSSTKIELYTEQLIDQGHAWPVYEEANEAFEGNPLKETYPLYFTQGKTRYRIHAYYSASQWFAENYEPCVNISPVDAEARGISNNDEVRVFNDRGSFVCTARVNEGLKPGVLFMAETTYTSKYIEGFLQNVTNDARNQRCYVMLHGPQIPYNDTLVQVEKA